MPGLRRVRWLAIAVCIAIVFFLYERSGAGPQVQQYGEQTKVGGGAVLRNPESELAPPPPQNPLLPKVEAKESRPTVAAATDQRIAGLPNLDTEKTSSSSLAIPTQSSAAPSTALKTGTKSKPESFVYEVPGEGFVDYDDPYTSTHLVPHWSKQPEVYPITSTIQLPTGTPKPIPRIQYIGKRGADKERLAAVKEAAQHAWKGYWENGWGYDEVRPVTGVGKDSFNGWGATLVDSLDTLWIMGMKTEFEDAVNKTSHIDFTTSSRNDIPLFEVTIRYLGGLLAAYDVSGRSYRVLLDKAVELGEILYSAFDTPNRMPETYYHWKPAYASNAHRASPRVVLAELGTLNLEFTRLAQLTGEPKYYDAIARVTDAFEEWQNSTRLPGMWPIKVDASGCKKPNQMSPSRTNRGHQKPIPGSDSYAITSEPVQPEYKPGTEAHAAASKSLGVRPVQSTGPLVIEDDVLAKAQKTVADSEDPHAMADAAMEAMNDNVHNPRPDSRKGSNLRFSSEHMPDDPSSNQKRQLDATTDTATLPNSSSRGSLPRQRQRPQGSPKSYGPYEVEPDICIPQGLASVGRYSSETFTLGGQSDSVYEYLPKEYVLLGGRLDQYKTMYLDSMEPVINRLLYRPMTPENLDILISGDMHISINQTTNELEEELLPKGEHLTCFAGGMLAMGGKLFDKPEHIEIGRKLTDGCIWTYNATKSGIMPEAFTASACESKIDCKWNETKYWNELDPNREYRELQRDKFFERYPDYTPPAKTVSSKAQRPTSHEETTSAKTNYKRQLDSVEPVRPAPTQPALAPSRPSPHGSDQLDVDHEVDTSYPTSSSTSAPKPTASHKTRPAHPVYTPQPPATHEEYVKQKIANDRLPPGFVQLGGKQYLLRPEAIESVFYMYRITGEQYWRDMGWKMFNNIERATRAQYGHSALDDVTKPFPEQINGMESFWLAETLKYFYLLFDEPDTWSLDDWVLNTEAHFFQRPKSSSN